MHIVFRFLRGTHGLVCTKNVSIQSQPGEQHFAVPHHLLSYVEKRYNTVMPSATAGFFGHCHEAGDPLQRVGMPRCRHSVSWPAHSFHLEGAAVSCTVTTSIPWPLSGGLEALNVFCH